MDNLAQQLIEKLITKQAFLKDYPKPGIIFLAVDPLFNDPVSRKIVANAVNASIRDLQFDAMASIASRGYLFSGIIANIHGDKGEYLVQKVKAKGDDHFVQLETVTEYSSDALQVLNNTVQKGKKYLLVDDLIATGGSALTAINLIRHCGGKVDTLFVMTELTDLNAKELLHKAGVEIVSILKLTNNDLQKLIALQESCIKNPNTPVTYQLSNYSKIEDQSQNADQHATIKRLVRLNNKKSKKYAKSGVLFTSSQPTQNNTAIDLYNQGCPAEKWNIDPALLTQNNFKVFGTGDAFSVISPNITINSANVNIHVGLEHQNYSPLVLLQEALQVCRCAYEHGAKSITVALPDQFHPIVHYSDFNNLLMKLFKASGAQNIYFYGKDYSGKLDDRNVNTTIDLTLSLHGDTDHYHIDRHELLNYLMEAPASEMDTDSRVMHLMRERKYRSTWKKFNTDKTASIDSILEKDNTDHVIVPTDQPTSHVILCCSANKPLAEKVAEALRQQGESVNVYAIEGYGDHAIIPDSAHLCNAQVTIIQSTRPNPDNISESKEYETNGSAKYFFEAAMIAWQANLRGAKCINLINPYQFGARSDKAEDNTKGKAGSYVQLNGLLLEAAGVNHIITAECHDNHTLSGTYTGKNIRGTAISALSVISTRLANEWITDTIHPLQGQVRLVMPDAGAEKRTKELTETLQAVMGDKLCKTRVQGDKQRDSHQDISALITGFNTGDVNINPHDKYLITDDETATGSTLCQAISKLKALGAKSISVVVAHNNMPLNWLTRQLCLAKFFYLGASDLHFSDTQEMGTLATNYEKLLTTYSSQTQLSRVDVEKQILDWFKINISNSFTDQSSEHLNMEFARFKEIFDQFNKNIRIHSLANEFANKIAMKPEKVLSSDSNVTVKLAVDTTTKPTVNNQVISPLYTSNSHATLFANNKKLPQILDDNFDQLVSNLNNKAS